jgi:molybdopterin-guanine dinucleotide biosynthesis protein A
MKRDDVTALILAGGKATRLGGVDKRQLVIDGRTIFERQLEALAPCVADVIVSSRRDVPGHRTVLDDVADLGPLGGIAAGLTAAGTPWLFVLAELVLSHATDDADAVGIRIAGRPEPLCSALRVAAWRPIVAARLAARQLRASSLLTEEAMRIRWIEDAELREVDSGLRSLHNVNAPEDL